MLLTSPHIKDTDNIKDNGLHAGNVETACYCRNLIVSTLNKQASKLLAYKSSDECRSREPICTVYRYTNSPPP
ncbi:hypothetical protein J6590_052053 [Homalodisca vitripennis]|nr:hypothetical protein J6590_052053 [Homalodisca vitripennis]